MASVSRPGSPVFRWAAPFFALWSLFGGIAFAADIPGLSVSLSTEAQCGSGCKETDYVPANRMLARVDSGTSVEEKRKSPLVAGVLGGVLGYGSGQYYSKRWISGTAFLILDGLLTALLVYTLVSEPEYELRAETVVEGLVEAVGTGMALGLQKSAALSLAVGGLVATHVAQGIWGPISANRYNREMLHVGHGTGPYVAPTSDGLHVEFAYSF